MSFGSTAGSESPPCPMQPLVSGLYLYLNLNLNLNTRTRYPMAET